MCQRLSTWWKNESAANDGERGWGPWIAGSIALAVILALVAVQAIFALKSEAWFCLSPNEFGDSFGAMNAIISGLAFAAFIVTLLMQAQELRLQRRELADSRAEARGSRRALEAQVQMSLQSARIASLSAILNHKFNQYTAQPAQRQAILTEMNRWTAELEAEITSLHMAGQPWRAANEMLHQAAVEIANAQSAGQSIQFPLNLPNDLPEGLEPALDAVDQLLIQSDAVNASRYQGGVFTDANDPLKPVVRAWLFKARETLELGIRQARLR